MLEVVVWSFRGCHPLRHIYYVIYEGNFKGKSRTDLIGSTIKTKIRSDQIRLKIAGLVRIDLMGTIKCLEIKLEIYFGCHLTYFESENFSASSFHHIF